MTDKKDATYDRFKRGDAVMVTWVDSASTSQWHHPDGEPYKPLKCATIGVVVSDSADRIVLAQSCTSEGQICNIMIIPNQCVTGIKKLRMPKQNG